jgi:hypothetical protein
MRDVAQAVAICGRIDTDKHDPATISVICEMQMASDVWLIVLNERIKNLKKELKVA